MSNNLPEGWEDVALEELLISLESGSRPQGGVRGLIEGIPSLGGEHLGEDGNFLLQNLKYVPKAFASNMNKGRIKYNDILIVKDGATTGKVAFVDKDFPYEVAVVNEHVFICRPSTLINAKTLYYFLRSEEGNKRVLTNFTGAAIGGINRNFARNTWVPVAPIQEQYRIAAGIEEMLMQVQELHERLNVFTSSLQKYRQDILSAAVSGELTEDWREDNFDIESAESLVERLIEKRISEYQEQVVSAKEANKPKPRSPKFDTSEVDSENFYEIPDSWLWTRLLNVADISGGIQKGKDVKGRQTIRLPYLRVANVQDGYFDLTDVKDITILPEEKDKYLLRKSDILFTEGGDRDKLGRGAIWQGDIPECVHQNHIFKARTLPEFVLPEYISLFTKTEVAKDHFFANATQSINLSSISMTTLGKTPIALPPIEEQYEILRKVDYLTEIADRLEAKFDQTKAEIESLPKIILAKAFAGELTEPDSNDEPVSVLLEQIRREREAIMNAPKPEKNKSQRSKNVETKLLEVIANAFAHGSFTFDDLRQQTTKSYETLRDELYELIEIDKQIVHQFDSATETLTFSLTADASPTN